MREVPSTHMSFKSVYMLILELTLLMCMAREQENGRNPKILKTDATRGFNWWRAERVWVKFICKTNLRDSVFSHLK